MFRSFFLGGFEGAAGHNIHRQWFDGVSLTRHDRFLHEDYALLKHHDIFAVRECVRWPLVDKGTHFDFASLDALITEGRAAGITTIYDLFHFGYPMALNPLSDEFLKRFVEYCYQVARRVALQTDDVCYFTPVNEPSYFAWAGGQVGAFAPYLKSAGRDLKIALVRAALQGTEAIWSACPNARIVTVDPFCRVVPSLPDNEAVQRAEFFNSSVVFEAWDMIAGRVMPELGGSPRHLDIIGINYYWTNQWVLDEPWAPLPDEDRRRMPLRHIAKTVWARYGREILISETSHIGDMRPRWMRELITETEAIRSFHIPLLGICWYPVLEMAEWHTPGLWTRLGLWDLVHQDGSMRRAAYKPVLRALREAQERLQVDGARVRRLFGGGRDEARIKASPGFP